MKPILRLLARVENALGWLAALAMIAMMLVVFCDVLMRYIFHSPLSWAYDLISLYLVAAVFYFSLSAAYSEGAHVNVDILQQTFPKTGIRLSEIVTAAVGTMIFGLIAYFGALKTIDAFVEKDVLSGAIAWPTWPANALVPLGCGLLALRLTLHFIGHVIDLATGSSLIPLSIGHHGDKERFE
ncbi:TRAP transporter small permease [Bosea sp. BH3]|uniref:TRAP transporter small permease n=1 Tax=Bosea sp. BH3 TaxID=2871701 RepID=UPI0021CB6089|nr:TRAP transporter small permease [Bosea sp. BH3]MCU4178857.1 TRAP transporter small permease [Bosea sp. BH3]